MFDFHDLYNTYAPDIYRFAYWLAGDYAEAEDITFCNFRAISSKILCR